MKPTVYLETTIIGYLAMRVSGVLRTAANQQTTRDWWDHHRQGFELFISRFVVDECSDGDPITAGERMQYLDAIPLLQITDDVDVLASALHTSVPLPEKAAIDALHISVAAVNGIEHLLTWNCRHIANPSLRPHIERICRDRGLNRR